MAAERELSEQDARRRAAFYLDKVGLSGHDVGLAHCVWVDERERGILRDTGTQLLHCPSSNLKLASGVAEIPELMGAGVAVSLGADGARR